MMTHDIGGEAGVLDGIVEPSGDLPFSGETEALENPHHFAQVRVRVWRSAILLGAMRTHGHPIGRLCQIHLHTGIA